VVTSGAVRCAELQSKCYHNKPTSVFLQAGCPSCHPTNNVRALKEGKLNVIILTASKTCQLSCSRKSQM